MSMCQLPLSSIGDSQHIFYNILVQLRKWFITIQKICASPSEVSTTELAASIEDSLTVAITRVASEDVVRKVRQHCS